MAWSLFAPMADAFLYACLRALTAALVRLRDSLSSANATLVSLEEAPAPLEQALVQPLRVLAVGINYSQCVDRLRLRGCSVDAAMNASHWMLLGARAAVSLTDDPSALSVAGGSERVSHLHSPLTLPVLEQALQLALEGGEGADDTSASELRFPADFAPEATQDDSIIVTLSCHGDRRQDLDGDEEDGLDEGLVMTDESLLTDDVLARMAVGSLRLHPARRVFFFMDFCHSGTVADQPFAYHSGDRRWLARDGTAVCVADIPPFGPEQGLITVFSGCQAAEKSYEQTGEDGRVQGLFSAAVRRNVRALSESVLLCFERVEAEVEGHGYVRQQRPLLCSSLPFGDDLKFLDVARVSAHK